jgi:hypothetical protein
LPVGDSCLATHGSLASALYTHCSSACSCVHPCGSLLSPQACLISSLPPITYAWQLSSLLGVLCQHEHS